MRFFDHQSTSRCITDERIEAFDSTKTSMKAICIVVIPKVTVYRKPRELCVTYFTSDGKLAKYRPIVLYIYSYFNSNFTHIIDLGFGPKVTLMDWLLDQSLHLCERRYFHFTTRVRIKLMPKNSFSSITSKLRTYFSNFYFKLFFCVENISLFYFLSVFIKLLEMDSNQ